MAIEVMLSISNHKLYNINHFLKLLKSFYKGVHVNLVFNFKKILIEEVNLVNLLIAVLSTKCFSTFFFQMLGGAA